MSDGVAITAGSGTTIATDDTGSGHVQIVRLAHGPDNALAFAGLSVAKNLDVDETEDAVKTSAGLIYGWVITNKATADRFVKFYDDTVANVVVGTTAPVMTLEIPALSAFVMPPAAHGIKFSNAITIAATTGVADNDTGAPGTNEIVANVFYS